MKHHGQPGPIVAILAPEVKQTGKDRLIVAKPVLDLVVEIRENAAPVAMETLEIKGKKGFFSLSLTDKVRPFIRGSRIEARGLTIPEGKFALEVSVADVDGARTVEVFKIEVAG
ncbi:MAG: hypothetical protein HQK81_13570 [Desulfovibrionaceae bacterium]|nr:hypothetical protein [Desulfovibrionaceae bacterium]MBF0515072.1 hypothetical protein [Desulfovibrionaceae bacterium]